jgi:hypothetical protein
MIGGGGGAQPPLLRLSAVTSSFQPVTRRSHESGCTADRDYQARFSSVGGHVDRKYVSAMPSDPGSGSHTSSQQGIRPATPRSELSRNLTPGKQRVAEHLARAAHVPARNVTHQRRNRLLETMNRTPGHAGMSALSNQQLACRSPKRNLLCERCGHSWLEIITSPQHDDRRDSETTDRRRASRTDRRQTRDQERQ